MTIPSLDQVNAEFARRKHIEFIKYHWQRKTPFIIGRHTHAICERIDEAIADYRKGISTHLVIHVPFRHGKSDIVSRYLPPHLLGEFPDDEILLVSHTFKKAMEFSRFSRKIMKSNEYIYNSKLARDYQGIEEWGLEDTNGKAQFAGMNTGVAGKGANFAIIDDYHKGRADAESQVIRDRNWECFTNDIMTRLAPVYIVFVLVTPWHKDDVCGRIKREMKADSEFPQFEFIKYPAFDDGYPTGTLFPERFSRKWYTNMTKFLGVYGTASLLQCDPTLKTGNMLKVDKINYINNDEEWKELTRNLQFVRAWDLASSEKQRKGNKQPDYTSGVKMAVKFIKNEFGLYVAKIYVEDWIRGQWEAPRRNEIIQATAVKDGRGVRVGIEGFGAYKDAYTQLKQILSGFTHVERSQLPGDKVAKASPLEAPFEVGNVYFKEAPWKNKVVNVIMEFPGGEKDDDVDAMAVGYDMFDNTQIAEFGNLNV